MKYFTFTYIYFICTHIYNYINTRTIKIVKMNQFVIFVAYFTDVKQRIFRDLNT